MFREGGEAGNCGRSVARFGVVAHTVRLRYTSESHSAIAEEFANVAQLVEQRTRNA